MESKDVDEDDINRFPSVPFLSSKFDFQLWVTLVVLQGGRRTTGISTPVLSLEWVVRFK